MTPGRRSIALVAAREIAERVRSRAFAISTLAIVVVVVAAVVVPGLRDATPRVRAGVTGATPRALIPALHDAARAEGARLRLRSYPSVAAGESALRDGRVGVLVVDGRGLVWNGEPDTRLAAIVTAAVQRLRLAERAAALGLSPAQAGALLRPAALPVRRLDAPDPGRDSRQTIAMIGFLLLLMVVVFYGNAVAEGVAQEKGGRVMEVLLCRVRAEDLLAGKVVGIGLVGLSQMLLAAVAGVIAIAVVDAVDAPAAVPATLAMTVVWFGLGYAFWSVVFAAGGALVSRAEDLSSAVLPLTWLLMIAALPAVFVQDAPDAWYMRVASFVPITAPFVVPVRAALGHPAAWEIALAVAVMLAATYGLVRLAARVYSGAVLRRGGRPGLRDVSRAARAR